jgi:hypothetical protein
MGRLEVHIELVSILIYVFFLLISDIVIHHSNIETCGSHKESSTPEVFVSSSSSSGSMFVVESNG